MEELATVLITAETCRAITITEIYVLAGSILTRCLYNNSKYRGVYPVFCMGFLGFGIFAFEKGERYVLRLVSEERSTPVGVVRKRRFAKSILSLAVTDEIAIFLTTSATAEEQQHAYSEYTNGSMGI